MRPGRNVRGSQQLVQAAGEFIQHQEDPCGPMLLNQPGGVLELHQNQRKPHFFVAHVCGKCPVNQSAKVRGLDVVGGVQRRKGLLDLARTQGGATMRGEP